MKVRNHIVSRAVGYCYNEECSEKHKGIFILNPSVKFFCSICRSQGEIVKEFVEVSNEDDPIFTEVRVNFDYDPIERRYKGTAIVRDEGEDLWGRTNVYTLNSPLIKTDKRALKVAETTLSNLDYYNLDEIKSGGWSTEYVLDLNAQDGNFKSKLKDLEARLSRSHKACAIAGKKR